MIWRENRRSGRRYGTALGILSMALLMRYVAFPDDAGLNFTFFFPGLAIVAVLCDLPATLMYVVVAALCGSYFFSYPYHAHDWSKLPHGAAFVASALVVVVTIEYYKRRVAAYASQLRAQVDERDSAMKHWRDATARLSRMQSIFHQTFDRAAVGIAHVAPDGHLLTVNKWFCDIVGYSPDELTALTFHDITFPDDLAEDVRLSDELLAGRRDSYLLEKRYVCKDGSLVWVNLAVSLVRDEAGAPAYFIGIVEDIRQRKQIEAALHESEEKFRVAFANAVIGVAVTTPDGRFVDFNPAYCRLTGYGPDELRRIGFQELVLPADASGNLLLNEALLDGRLGSFVTENRYRHKSGRPVWVRKSVSIVRDEQGQARWIIALVENIEERKEAELAAGRALDEARKANDAKTRFLAAASHDLRQPLSALSIYASSLSGVVVETGRPLLTNMRACVSSLSELLNDLLDLSKLQAGVVQASPGTFPLQALWDELESVHRPEAALKGLTLKFRATPLMIGTDRVLFRQVLGNFIANAIRYAEHGGILVAGRRHAGKCWVEVWDTGIGIPDNRKQDIFEEFVQIDSARKRGSGLGLAIVARIADLLGLAVRVESRLGRGSLFAIEAPPCPVDAVLATAAEELGTYSQRHVVVIEDNDAVRIAIEHGLRSVGHQVVSAASRQAVAPLLADFSPDVVISDYRLGNGETGLEAIHFLRQKTRPDLPALLITGDTDPTLVRSMTDSGVIVLHKPVELETLLAYLEDMTFQGG